MAPLPLAGRGWGWGSTRQVFPCHPPPQPSPARGEGANGGLLRCHWLTRTNGSPPPCGEGLGVGVHTTSLSVSPPTPTLPRKGGGSEREPAEVSLVDANEWLPSPLRGGVGGGGPHDKSFRVTPHPNPPPEGGRERTGAC